MTHKKIRIALFLTVFISLFLSVYSHNTAHAINDDIYVSVGTKKHIEVDNRSLSFIEINQNKGTYDVYISNVCMKLESGESTTIYNHYICFNCGDDEWYLGNGQTSLYKSIKYDSDIDAPWFLDVSADYGTPNGTISFDLLVTLKKSDIKLNTTKITVYFDNSEFGKTLSVKGATSKVTWKSSNKKIAQVERDPEDETTYGSKAVVYPGKKMGKCYVYASSQGKTVKCKVTTSGRKNLKLVGYIMSYNTRKNTFYVKFINYSHKKVKICKTGAIAVDSNYTSFDRNLKLNKSVSISPGKKKKVAFKVIGNNTWWNHMDFCINYSVTYKNKKYRLASDTEYTWCRKKGKWKKMGTYDFNY